MGLNRKVEFWRYFSLITGLGLAVVGSILVGFIVGFLLDRCLKTNMLFTFIFLVFGIIGGFTAAYKLIVDIDKDKGKSQRD